MLRKSDGILGATTLCNLHGAAHRCSTVSRSDVFYRRGIRAGFQANKIQGTLIFWDYLELKLSIYIRSLCTSLFICDVDLLRSVCRYSGHGNTNRTCHVGSYLR